MIGFFDDALLLLSAYKTPIFPIHAVENRNYGFEVPDCEGKQFAILPMKTQLTVFAQRGEWEMRIPADWDITPYTKEKTRSHHLPKCAPKVALGKEAVSLAITKLTDFERFLDIYTE